MVDVSGLSYPELLIVPDRKKLESLGISEQTLENALQRNNIKLGNLTIREGEYQYDIRFESDILSKKDIENVYLNIHDRLYQFKDLATVIEHPQRRQGMVRSDSHNAVSMAVIKQSDAQMSDLRAEINGLMQHFRNGIRTYSSPLPGPDAVARIFDRQPAQRHHRGRYCWLV